MIITGYDDEAIAIDKLGHQHKGLFTLRNSWGSSVADKGNFYMSYDYFKTLAMEAYKIGVTRASK
jgi:C1A family cysteine protease